jgi:hypothetical protein
LARRWFRAAGGREHHTITAPRRGANRERARQAIMKLLARAAHNGHRVAFTITTADAMRWRLGAKGGYDPARALTACQIEREDPYAWLADQLHGRLPAGSVIIGVDLDEWPATS